jgi:isopentenyl diphosphate isomerase/L-lactate dehydrogenase-like FMN-dependent dehydrogenase
MANLTSCLARRRFLRFLAGSPLAVAAWPQDGGEAIAAPDQALNVLDFEAAARQKLPPAHFGYLTTGVDDDATIRANREGFSHYSLRVRRLVDVRAIDMSVSLFGVTWDSPIALAPVGNQRAFHPAGEIATAKAAKARNHLQILSTVTATAVEEVNAARGMPVWYQLYPTDQAAVGKALVKRAEAAGCPALALTVDQQAGSNRETLRRWRRKDTRECSACHLGDPLHWASNLPKKPMFAGLDAAKVTRTSPLEMSWDYVKQLRDAWPRKLLLKGIVTREDAEAAIEHGVDGLIVSNHGGRGEESIRPTIESLREVAAGVRGRVPVLMDGGVRRGTDIFKALALGANAICIGRPYVWGLAAFGQQGVETVLDILRRELLLVMRQAGTRRLGEIGPAYVVEERRR